MLVKFRLVYRVLNEMILYCISELLLPILIQIYDKNHISFDHFKYKGLPKILQAIKCQILWLY